MSVSLEQKLAIHELLGRAAYAYDERDIPLLNECFASDAKLTMRIAGGDLIGPFEGKEAVMALMTGSMAEQTDVRRHVISNIFFDERAETATVISNLTLMATENNEIQLLSAGVYRDEVVEEDGGWRVRNRHIELDKSY
jgi:3-phenylpropionate/cinnamic acid dioxygenase small subunit